MHNDSVSPKGLIQIVKPNLQTQLADPQEDAIAKTLILHLPPSHSPEFKHSSLKVTALQN